ncbi:hypothetical protein CBR_g19442 [Chara braunii]|uniref:NADP-dependent oxidoreductase domain-containing protein n=1 Tax=Chara braunii TaxID=69332 RepID=A0A388KY26_CHABU|nr:hypothetical protein CBR_g19442 [Chara braunii]|eukprot:GBG74928.1 hypothetical protein CBR_g19442 [Chara braunii]
MAGAMTTGAAFGGTMGMSSLSRLEDLGYGSAGHNVKGLGLSGCTNRSTPYQRLSGTASSTSSCRDSPPPSSSSSTSSSSTSSSSSLNWLPTKVRRHQRDLVCAAVATPEGCVIDAASVSIEASETRVRLGSSDVEVPQLGIGSWAWGDRFFWNDGQWDDKKVKGVKQAFEAAMDSGIPFFDTAELYGRTMIGQEESESLLGRFIRERKRAKARSQQYGNANQIGEKEQEQEKNQIGEEDQEQEKEQEKEKVFIATKFSPFPWRLGRQAVVNAAKGSLARLGVERIDLYQLHWPGQWQNEAYWDGLADVVEAGLVRAVGVSNYNAKRMREAHAVLAKRGIPLASNQVHYNLLYRTPETSGVKAACDELGITLIAYSPIAHGVLSGKYTADRPPASGFRVSTFPPEYLRKAAPLLARLTTLGEEYGKTPTQVALNWLVVQGNVVPIPGAKTAEQAKEFAGALGWRMTPQHVAELRQLAQPVPRYPGLPVERVHHNWLRDRWKATLTNQSVACHSIPRVIGEKRSLQSRR